MKDEAIKKLLEACQTLKGFRVGLIEPRQYEPETISAVCPSCHVTFRVLRFQESAPWLERHRVECRKRPEAARAFYREHRRWPRPGEAGRLKKTKAGKHE